MAPSLSIIIPTKNRPDALAEALRSIKAQSVQPDEVIVVDQSPGAPYAHVSGCATARNVAIEKARGDILLFLDDDVTLYPCFVENLLASYAEHPEATGISGIPDNYPAPVKSFYFYWSKIFMMEPFYDDRQPIYWFDGGLQKAVPVSRMTGAMMSFKRSAINGTRFDSSLRGNSDGEDVDFCMQLGREAKFFIDPRCKMTHHFNPSGRESDWLRRHARAYTYLYLRNWRDCKSTYIWLWTGWLFAAALSCARRMSVAPLRSLFTGYREGHGVGSRG